MFLPFCGEALDLLRLNNHTREGPRMIAQCLTQKHNQKLTTVNGHLLRLRNTPPQIYLYTSVLITVDSHQMPNAFYWLQRRQRLHPAPPVPLTDQEIQHELRRKYRRTWCEKNRVRTRAYQVANREKYRKASLKYYAKHRESMLVYMRANAHKYR